MPHRGGKKRNTPRKNYAQKAQQKANGGQRKPNTMELKAKADEEGDYNVFSMLDAARNTEHRGAWGGKELRHGKVDFVSASSEVARDQTSDDDLLGMENNNYAGLENANIDEDVGPGLTGHNIRQATEASTSRYAIQSVPDEKKLRNEVNPKLESEPFFFNLKGDPQSTEFRSHSTQHGKEQVEQKSEPSDSGEDIVVFRGRREELKAKSHVQARDNAVRVVEDNIRAVSIDDRASYRSRSERATPTRSPLPALSSLRKAGNSLENENSPEKSAEELAIEDYLDNLLQQSNSESDTTERGFEDVLGSQRNNDHTNDAGDDQESVLSSEDDIDSDDSPPDDSKLDKARTAMTDEELAHRLAKQEELGLGSSELLLWHEEDMATLAASGDEDIENLRHAAREFHHSERRWRKGRQRSTLPPMIGEQDLLDNNGYRSFDIMEFDRPSSQTKAKGANKNLPFQLSDSELEANMIVAWENDRKRKKMRKQKREMLREEVLFASENGGMMRKYPNGISVDEVKLEIKSFMESDSVSLPLIPMDKRARKAVHEIANKLNMHSKSKGKGLHRYPCLYKTSSTFVLDQTLLDSIIMQYSLGHMSKRLGGKGKTRALEGAIRPSGRGGGITSGVSYRDGELVGSGAPAIGSENKGHALLSKMGWTTGTALGALNNKGSLEPVAQIVKVTKAGLG